MKVIKVPTDLMPLLIQWALLNVITDNVINLIFLSNLSKLTSSKSLSYTWCKHQVCSLIVILQLMLSVCLCTKVITLSSFHCYINNTLLEYILVFTSMRTRFEQKSKPKCNNFPLNKWVGYIQENETKNIILRLGKTFEA